MKVLVIGLGSMGKRRIRCLKSLGIEHITGIDSRRDRCQESEHNLINTHYNATVSEISNFDCALICTPPNTHEMYMRLCTEAGISFFIEAGVDSSGYEDIAFEAKQKGIVVAPSSTLTFHPGIRLITELITTGEVGKISHFVYQSGQYLPDWHPYEQVSEFYVSKKEMGGAREIVPFEYTWLANCFGMPVNVQAIVSKTIDINGADEIDDSYSLLMRYDGYHGFLMVDVVNRFATRRLTVVGSTGTLEWDWNEDQIQIYRDGNWKVYPYQKGESATGYNANIPELMYIDEIASFLNSVNGKSEYGNSLEKDAQILEVLYAAEKSSKECRAVPL